MTEATSEATGTMAVAVAGTELLRTVEAYWAAAEARDWDAFAETLADDVLYELPQTRERVRGKERYARFNREYPGDWHLRIERIVADEEGAVTWVHMAVGLEEMYGIAFFTGNGEGRIKTVTDFWPEPYEPPVGREHLVERY
jgi:hypothetical protein